MKDIIDFLKKTRDAVHHSYQFEYAGIDVSSGLDKKTGLSTGVFFNDVVSPLLLSRASFFLEIKDAYHELTQTEQKTINFYVRQHTKNDNFAEFIDSIVGGADGTGACLQSATHSLETLHNQLVEDFSELLENETILSELKIEFNQYDYHDLPQLDIVGSYFAELLSKSRSVTHEEHEAKAHFLEVYNQLMMQNMGIYMNIEPIDSIVMYVNLSLLEIIQHARKSDNFCRAVCVHLGWLDKEGNISASAPEIISEMMNMPPKNKI